MFFDLNSFGMENIEIININVIIILKMIIHLNNIFNMIKELKK